MTLQPPCDVFVLAGEASGDAYAAAVIRRLRQRHPDLVVAGMGGPECAAAGMEIEQPIDGLAVMGLIPVLARLPMFLRIARRVESVIRAPRPRVVLSVDYPAFNLRLQRRLADLRRDGMRLVHLVAPQVWAWKPRRAKPVARSVDRLLCFFPFEPPLFSGFGVQADWVGHPLIDLMQARPTNPIKQSIDSDSGIRLSVGAKLLLLAPGSREREVSLILPAMHAAAEGLIRRLRAQGAGSVQAVVAKVRDLPHELYRSHTDLPLVEGRWRDLLYSAHLAFIGSGTATLEAAIAGCVQVIGYKADTLSIAIARKFLLVDSFGLPNIVAGRRIVPEVAQHELVPDRLIAHGLRLWAGPHRRAQQAALREVCATLGGPGAMDRIADALDEELRRGQRGATRIAGMGRPTDGA